MGVWYRDIFRLHSWIVQGLQDAQHLPTYLQQHLLVQSSIVNLANSPLTATIQKIITEILGDRSGLTFGKDARDLLIDCSVEFITLISSEANEIAEKEAKKTIAPEHIDKALRELGFPEYVAGVLAVAGEHKEQLRVKWLILVLMRNINSLVDTRKEDK